MEGFLSFGVLKGLGVCSKDMFKSSEKTSPIWYHNIYIYAYMYTIHIYIISYDIISYYIS